MSEPGSDLREAVQRKGSFFKSLKAVAWSFFGVRRNDGYEEDISQLNPLHVIIAGLLAALVFVASLVLLVRWILSSGIAQP